MDFIIGLNDVTDREAFFAELLAFYSQHEVVLTTWGKIPFNVEKRLRDYRAPCSWIRRYAFRQSEWHLTSQSVAALTQELCTEDVLSNLTWGLIKGDTPLGLSQSWDDMNIDSSEWIEDATLFHWLNDLRSKGLLKSYEKVTD